MEGRVFKVYDELGEEIDCEVIMFYHSTINDTDYVFYTDYNYDLDGNLNLYASRYLGEVDGEMKLLEIEDENEWGLLDNVLEQVKESMKNEG